MLIVCGNNEGIWGVGYNGRDMAKHTLLLNGFREAGETKEEVYFVVCTADKNW